MRGAIRSACVIGLLVAPLTGCAGAVLAGIPLNFFTTEVAPRAINGKGLAEDGADWVTGKDCRLVEGVTRKDRQICEPRGSPATQEDFKGLSGLSTDPPARKTR